MAMVLESVHTNDVLPLSQLFGWNMTFFSTKPLVFLCEADLVMAGRVSGSNFPHSLNSGTNSVTGCCTRAQNIGKHQTLLLSSVSW